MIYKGRAIDASNNQEIAGLSFSSDGSFLHVAVEGGTSLQIYNVKKRALIKELARGATPALVNCISSGDGYMACCSDRKTVHLFNVSTELA